MVSFVLYNWYMEHIKAILKLKITDKQKLDLIKSFIEGKSPLIISGFNQTDVQPLHRGYFPNGTPSTSSGTTYC